MRALIDAHMMGADETGNETYMRGLLQGLLEIGAPQIVAVNESGRRALAPHSLADGVDARAGMPRSRTSAADALTHDLRLLRHASDLGRLLTDLPGLARDVGASLVHCTYVSPPHSPVPTVLTVHDASFARHSAWFTWRDLLLLRAAVPYSARRARAVITPSEHARSEVVELLGVSPARIHVTPEACGAEFRPLGSTERAEPLRRCGVEGPYVLSLGNLQPRKNLRRLLRAWAHLRDAGGLQDHRLVLAGGTRGRCEPVAHIVHEMGLGRDVLLTGYVATADLPALYAGASAFVYPSLYEGFGLPLLEAMACGTPVACSNAASLPEVAGDAALLFDPFDTEAIAASLGALLADSGLRGALAARGSSRAARFSWAACARATLSAYEAALD